MKPSALAKGQAVLIPSVDHLVGFLPRLRGLIGRSKLEVGQAVHLMPASSVHTCMMRFDLDIVFLTRSLRVCRIVRGMKPWRMALGGRAAWSVLEMQAGWFPCDSLSVGDAVEFIEPMVAH